MRTKLLISLFLTICIAAMVSGDNTLHQNSGTGTFSTVSGSDIASDVALAGNPTTTSQAATDNSTKIATTAYVTTAGGWVISTVTGSDATTTGQALVNVTGLTFATAANTTYEVEVVIMNNTSLDTTGIKYGFDHSGAGASGNFVLTGGSTSTLLAGGTLNGMATSSPQTFCTSSGMTSVCVVHGFLITGANAGNFTFQHLKVTSGTSTVKIGSVMKVRKVV